MPLHLCHVHSHVQWAWFPYQLIFEPLALDVKLNSGWAQTGTGAWTGTGAAGAEVAAAASAVGAAAVLHPTDLIDCDTAKASAPQG